MSMIMQRALLRRIAELCAAVPLVLITLAWLVAGTSVAVAEKRVALVIGNSSYAGLSKLANPENDARAMAKMLADVGFDVGEVQLDLGLIEFNRG
jgi:hypothetical protein